jgi:hypothetical protein
MAYLSLADLKLYLGIAGTADDDLLDDLLPAAQAAIDTYCDRTFEAASDTTRVFDSTIAAINRVLYLDADLAQISTVTNGDTAATTIAVSAYKTQPYDPPYYALELRPTAPVAWRGDVSITGRWAYSVSAPEAIVQATREYAAYLYRSADRQMARDVAALPALPDHLRRLLSSYRRIR